jgi:hypothetical protein
MPASLVEYHADACIARTTGDYTGYPVQNAHRFPEHQITDRHDALADAETAGLWKLQQDLGRRDVHASAAAVRSLVELHSDALTVQLPDNYPADPSNRHNRPAGLEIRACRHFLPHERRLTPAPNETRIERPAFRIAMFAAARWAVPFYNFQNTRH